MAARHATSTRNLPAHSCLGSLLAQVGPWGVVTEIFDPLYYTLPIESLFTGFSISTSKTFTKHRDVNQLNFASFRTLMLLILLLQYFSNKLLYLFRSNTIITQHIRLQYKSWKLWGVSITKRYFLTKILGLIGFMRNYGYEQFDLKV